MIESRGHSQDGEGSSIDLTTQILSLRLLSTILPHSKLDMAVQDRLFKLVGHTALMCRIDGSHFGDQGLLQKVRKNYISFTFVYFLSAVCLQILGSKRSWYSCGINFSTIKYN